MTLSFGAFLGEDVTHVRAFAFVATRTGTFKPLGSTANGFLLVGHCFSPGTSRGGSLDSGFPQCWYR